MKNKYGIDWYWRMLLAVAGLALTGLAVNWFAAAWMLSSNLQHAAVCLNGPAWPISQGTMELLVTETKTAVDVPETRLQASLCVDNACGRLELDLPNLGKAALLSASNTLCLWTPVHTSYFMATNAVLPETRQALAEWAALLSGRSRLMHFAICLGGGPFLTGLTRQDSQWQWRFRLRNMRGWLAADGVLRRIEIRRPQQSSLTITLTERPLTMVPDFDPPPGHQAIVVPDGELDAGLAAILRLAKLQTQPVPRQPDGEFRCGAGRLCLQNGRRTLYLQGAPYELGFQHGKLLAQCIRSHLPRTVYGLTIIYSLKQGSWFLDDARVLIERQRPYLDTAYQEEMRGLADGSGIALEMVQTANLIPEFFHCSGAAVFGRATSQGQLLHARVLDYMTYMGLQDAAVVMAIAGEGVQRFVSVGYAGFIGCVTGMNESQIAIGEMGGGGYGHWDGTPMSFLMRGALEQSASLDEAVAWMRNRRRTCEYYYVISDAKIPDAVGIAALPDTFEVLRAGQAVARLPEAIPDAVLMSSGNHYRCLVARVREHYGQIDAPLFFDIVKRPVARHSNLHNVIFEPRELRIWVANATRHGLACDQTAAVYEWDTLFP